MGKSVERTVCITVNLGKHLENGGKSRFFAVLSCFIKEEEIFYLVRRKSPLGIELSKKLKETIQAYHNRVITATAVAQMMVEARKRLLEERRKKEALGLTDEEMVFYDLVENMGVGVFSNEFLAGLIRKVVAAMKKEFQNRYE